MRDSWDNMFEEVPASFEARMKETLSALEEKPKIRRFRFGTGALVAAALLVVVLGGTALATDFFGLKSLTVTDPNYIIHSPLDDFIPFNEWFIFPYGSWFFLLAGVTALLWWFDTASYDKLCLMMFSGMTFCLILYMVLPNGLDIRPTVEEVGRSNLAMTLMQLIWKADASVNVCPSIHCQSSACMAIAFSGSTLAKDRPWLKVLAFGWAALICASTVFTKQHSIIDVFCGLAVAFIWVPVLYLRPRKR